MLHRREGIRDWLSAYVYRFFPLPAVLQWIHDVFPEEHLVKVVQPFYDGEMGRPSEDPIMLLKLLFLAFYDNIEGDENIMATLNYRLDWRQFCGLSLFATLPDRTTLVKFRRRVGPVLIAALFEHLVDTLRHRGLIDSQHRFFDGTPATARACINPYRDEIYNETLAQIAAKLEQSPSPTVEVTPEMNPSPVQLEKTTYPLGPQAIHRRRQEPMKPVAERQSAGDPEARFQRSKHGRPSELGYEIFFTTDAQQLFIEDVDVSATACQGQTIFAEKLAQSEPGHTWSVDAEFSTGPLLEQAEHRGIILNTPPRVQSPNGLFPKTAFVYQPDADRYRCPNEHTLSYVSTNRKTEARTYRSAKGTCAECPLRTQCTTSKTERTITRSRYEVQFEQQREHALTPQAVIGRVLRGIIAEGKFAEAVRHGLKTMRYVGHTMAVMQSQLVATILNFKRLFRVEHATSRV